MYRLRALFARLFTRPVMARRRGARPRQGSERSGHGCGRTDGTIIPPRLISHRATPVKVVRAPRGSTFPGGRFPLVAALLGASARDSACRGKPGAVAPPISRKGSGKAHGSRRPTNMRIYEASIAYNLVQLGDVQALTTPDKIAEYLRDAYAKNPFQESLWVV